MSCLGGLFGYTLEWQKTATSSDGKAWAVNKTYCHYHPKVNADIRVYGGNWGKPWPWNKKESGAVRVYVILEEPHSNFQVGAENTPCSR